MLHYPQWLKKVYSVKERNIVVDKILREILNDRKVFTINYIVASGISSITIASIVSFCLNLPLAIVRVKGDPTHSPFIFEADYPLYDINPFNWIFIDDVINKGDTLKRICTIIDAETCANKLQKIYLYNGNSGMKWENTPIFYVK